MKGSNISLTCALLAIAPGSKLFNKTSTNEKKSIITAVFAKFGFLRLIVEETESFGKLHSSFVLQIFQKIHK